MRQRVRARLSGERGFTLIELLVVIILVGILAGIALAVFLNQADKGNDAAAKSAVTNLSRLMQACRQGTSNNDSFTDCDTPTKLGENTLEISTDPPNPPNDGGDCGTPTSTTITAPSKVRIDQVGTNCFTIIGVSRSGNVFWYEKRNDGSTIRGCQNAGVNGCPSGGGDWAG